MTAEAQFDDPLAKAARDIRARPGFLLRQIQQHLSALIGPSLAALDATLPQVEALGAIRRTPGADQSGLARMVGLDPATAGVVAEAIEKRGLIVRKIDADRRRRTLFAEPAGDALMQEALRVVLPANGRLLAAVDKDQAAAVMRGLRALARHTGSRAPAWTPSAPGAMPLFDQPSFLIRRALQIAAALFHQEAAGFGLTAAQYAMLARIAAFAAPDQASFLQKFAAPRSSVVPLVRALEAKGYVRRLPGAEDGRKRSLALEPAGRALLRDIHPAVTRSEVLLLAPLDHVQAHALVRGLAAITEAQA
ncbi:MAG: MarR family transcriptional regulator [Caulobacteraceae bacterium]